MYRRKIMAVVTAFSMIMSAYALPVSGRLSFGTITAAAQTSGDYEYEVVDGGVSITAYYGGAETLDIPASIDGKAVKAIGGGAFSSAGLTKVSIPSGVESIGPDAFSFCDGLASVSLPNTLRSIDVCAFSGCALTKVSIPDSVVSIGEGAFLDNAALTEVRLPDKDIAVESEAFHNCTKLRMVEIPRGISNIGDMAFGFYDDEEGIPVKLSDFKIKCYMNSSAHEYAYINDLGREFYDPDTENTTEITEKNFRVIPEDKRVSDEILGDVDGDGEISINDAVMVIASVNGNFVLDERSKLLADVDKDGAVDVSDAVMIIAHINGIKPIGG